MDDPKIRHRESMVRRKIKKYCFALDCCALVILLASLFSLPFPFVRQLWLQSVIGALGFVNCGLILWMTARIRSLSYPAIFGGFGLIFHEQLLAVRSFAALYRRNAAGEHDALFLAATVVFCLGLAFLFGKCLKPLTGHSKSFGRDFYMEHRRSISTEAASLQVQTLVENVAIYSVLMIGLWQSRVLDLPLHFSACKLIGELTCVAGFRGIAKEIDLYYKEAQQKGVMLVKILSHILVAGGVLFIIYKIMPVEPFLR